MNWRKWLDDFVLAGKGILLATKEKRFWWGFVPTFLFFMMLINLLAGGFSKFELMVATGFDGTMKILGDSFLAIFGINQIFGEWLPTFLLALLQGILVGLIVLLWKKKRDNAAGVEKAGIITGLIAIGAGCPACGTTLLTPLLTTIFSTGALAAAGVISTVVTVIAVILAIFSLKRLGLETYVTIINEQFLQKKSEKQTALQSKEKTDINRSKSRKEKNAKS